MFKNYQIGVPTTLQITVENTMSFDDIAQLTQPSKVKISSKDQQVLIEFFNGYGRSVRQKTDRQETKMAKAGTLPSFCYDSTRGDTHAVLAQAMNESTREQMEEEVSHENNKHAELEDEVAYLSSSGDGDFADERISREHFFLIGESTKYDRAASVNIRYIT